MYTTKHNNSVQFWYLLITSVLGIANLQDDGESSNWLWKMIIQMIITSQDQLCEQKWTARQIWMHSTSTCIIKPHNLVNWFLTTKRNLTRWDYKKKRLSYSMIRKTWINSNARNTIQYRCCSDHKQYLLTSKTSLITPKYLNSNIIN